MILVFLHALLTAKHITRKELAFLKRSMENNKFKILVVNEHRDTLDLLKDLRESEKRYAFLAQTANEMAGLCSVSEIYIYTARKINQLLTIRALLPSWNLTTKQIFGGCSTLKG